MWRATFLALGISFCIFGLECLVVDKAVFRDREAEAAEGATQAYLLPTTTTTEKKEFKPKEWMPWSMLSTGAVVILYSITIPKRAG